MSVKRFVVSLLCLFFLGAMAPDVWAQRGEGPPPAQAEHTILVVIDGFSYLAPERVEMPNLRAIMARGSYFRESYSAPPETQGLAASCRRSESRVHDEAAMRTSDTVRGSVIQS